MSKIAGSGSEYGLVRGMDPRIRIHTKMSWIRNTGKFKRFSTFLDSKLVFKIKSVFWIPDSLSPDPDPAF
jgi:hypothetical protein